MTRAARRRRLVLALLLANALVMLRTAGEPAAPSSSAVRALRQAAIRAARAAGRTTYSFETRWTPPVTR